MTTKMSKVQRAETLAGHNYSGMKLRGMLLAHPRTLEVLVRNGWARKDAAETYWSTTAGLIAAGVDLDAIHAEALIENERRAHAHAVAVAVAVDSPSSSNADIARAYADLDRAAMACTATPASMRGGSRVHNHLLATGPDCNQHWRDAP